MGKIEIAFAEERGKIKDMNSVNNGPDGEFDYGSYDAYAAARIPFARLHDSAFNWHHTVDVICVFPDFDADENDPASYDFTLTDEYLDTIEKTGTKIFYRLGNSIEPESKKYGAIPPKDYRKWARICEHVIRHENEGWADGFHRGIKYWEIWNEPDLVGHQCWTGTISEFIEFYDVASRHLKGCFPDLMIGGPALTHVKRTEWWDEFVPYLKEKKPPMDFFSFHKYGSVPEKFAEDVEIARNYLNEAGYPSCELILDEWNYLLGWQPKEKVHHSYQALHTLKGASFAAAVMTVCQRTSLDHLMYYDARHSSYFNGLFERYTWENLKPYYAFYAFADLADLGTEVGVRTEGEGLYALAAKSADGKRGALLLTNYRNEITLDGKGYEPEEVKIGWTGLSDKPVRVTVRLLDNEHDLSEISGETFGSGAGSHTLSLPLFGTVLVKYDAE
ncbi:MAG: hypothetical protein J6P88_04940 [Clostridia bacterium]|nr:hypothetical protein [Clostridia bacterium]